MSKILSNKSQCNQGFTIVEVVVAVTILSLVVIAFTFMLQYLANAGYANRVRLAAIKIASQQIEDIRALDYGKVGYDPNYSDDDNDGIIQYLPDDFFLNQDKYVDVTGSGSTLVYKKLVTIPDDDSVSCYVYNDIRWNDPVIEDFKKVHIEVWAPARLSGEPLDLVDVVQMDTNVASLSTP